MSILKEERGYTEVAHVGYEALDYALSLSPPTPDDMSRHGKVVLRDYAILETPRSVVDAGEILTNPSQIEYLDAYHNGRRGKFPVFFARREPRDDHIGKTKSVACTIDTNGRKPALQIVDSIPILDGEDPRLIPNFILPGRNGKTHRGIAISAVVAKRDPVSKDANAIIEQVYYWGETIQNMKKIFSIPNLKNTYPYPLFNITGDLNDTRVDVFGRPTRDITYFRAKSIFDITPEKIALAQNLTKGKLPPDVHTGVNAVRADARHPDYRELSTHNAHVYYDRSQVGTAIKKMTYVICRKSFHIPTQRIVTLQEVARRTDFPVGPIKPSDPTAGKYIDYEHILYGACGNPDSRYTVVGASDNGIAIARKFHVYS